MNAGRSRQQPFWLPATIFAGCLILAFVSPIVFMSVERVPGPLLDVSLLALLYVFPIEARRMPDLPSGIHPGPGFLYELGTLPVLLVWVSATLLFGVLGGRFARGFRLWQLFGLASLAIAAVTLVMQVVLRRVGFQPDLTLP